MTTNKRPEKPIELVIARLEQVGGAPRPQPSGGWMARCPAHDDQTPSLSISESDDGKVLLHCHAGCKVAMIVTALSLTIKDLFPPKKAKKQSRLVAAYGYTDEKATLLYEKVRYEPKSFSQRRPDGQGGWIWNLGAGWYTSSNGAWTAIAGATNPKQQPTDTAVWFPEVRKVLYRLPGVINAVSQKLPVYFVEGEKDVENLVNLGFTATTNQCGAGEAWDPAYGACLKGASVVIIPDDDPPGLEHAEKYATALSGIAAEVKLVRLPNLPTGGKDVSDWIAAGHTKMELEVLVAATQPYVPPGTPVIMDSGPDEIRRPLCLVRDHAYAAAWAHVKAGDKESRELFVIRDDGTVYNHEPFLGVQPLSDLGLNVHLPEAPPPGRGWSGAGVNAYRSGKRPNPDISHRHITSG